jgi:hypothetical protein
VELIDSTSNRACLVRNVGRTPHEADYCITSGPYVRYLKDLGAHTLEVSCVDGATPWLLSSVHDVLSYFEGIRTLVLPGHVVSSYLFALAEGYK